MSGVLACPRRVYPCDGPKARRDNTVSLLIITREAAVTPHPVTLERRRQRLKKEPLSCYLSYCRVYVKKLDAAVKSKTRELLGLSGSAVDILEVPFTARYG